jgi:protein involved in ribonucleotide reduction
MAQHLRSTNSVTHSAVPVLARRIFFRAANPTARGRGQIASGKRNWNQNLYSLANDATGWGFT